MFKRGVLMVGIQPGDQQRRYSQVGSLSEDL